MKLTSQDSKTPDNDASQAIADIAPPALAVEDKATENAANPPSMSPPFNSAVCNLTQYGMDSTSDWNTNMNMSDFSLDPLLKQYKLLKKKIEDEIEGWVAAQAPDGSRTATLAAVIAKRLKELIQIVQCANKVLTSVMKIIQDYSTNIIKIMNKIRAYIAHNTALISAIQKELANLPNTIVMSIMSGINNELTSLTSGGIFKDAATLLRDINALKANCQGLNGFVQSQITQIRSSVQQVCDEAAASKVELNSLNWNLASVNLLQDFLQIATPQEISWVNQITALSNNDIVSATISVGGGDTGSDSKVVPPSNTLTIKTLAALLSAEISKTNSNVSVIQAQTSDIVFQLNKFTSKLNKLVNYQNQNQAMIASLHSMGVKLQEAQAQLITMAATDFSVDTRTIQYGQAAFSFTMTNNAATFTNYNGVTNSTLMSQINSSQDDVWIDIFSASKPGYLLIGSTPYGAIELDSNIADPDISTGLRLLIDNGLYIIEAYSQNDPDQVTNGYNVNYGKFTTVPMAPTPETYVYATLQEFNCAWNNLLALTHDPSIVLVSNGPVSGDYNAGEWQRYLTQQEIGEMEQAYVSALAAFNLSPKFDQQTQTVYTGSSRVYAVPTDTQLSDLLIGSKPFNGMKIPANSLTLQFSKINININSTCTKLDSVKYPYGIQCDWGYLSEF